MNMPLALALKEKAQHLPLRIVYEATMCLLALLAVGIAICELKWQLGEGWNITGRIIYWVFVADYFAGLALAKERWQYIKTHLWELIAIIPFEEIFRMARLARTVKILRLIRIIRAASFLGRFIHRTQQFLDTCGFKYALMLFIGVTITGALCYHYVEGYELTRSCWSSLATVTGGGDIPTSLLGRLMGIVLMIIGISFMGMLTGTITTYFTRLRTEGTTPSSPPAPLIITLHLHIS